MKKRTLNQPDRWILWGIPFLFVIGSLLHFAFDFLGQNPVVGLFAPVNESVWEHIKMVVWPTILWWTVYYRIQGERQGILKDTWLCGALAALLVSMAAIPMLYYFYTSAFGVEILWVDILILFLAISAGQLWGLHVYRYGKGCDPATVLVIFGIVTLLFMFFTFFPPHFPLFLDAPSGSYGIQANFR